MFRRRDFCRPYGCRNLEYLNLCVLGVSAVSSFWVGIPPPRRKVHRGYAEKKAFSDRHFKTFDLFIHLQDGEKSFLRNLYPANFLHPFFAFLLFLEQLAFA
jgi:hypothetical protein